MKGGLLFWFVDDDGLDDRVLLVAMEDVFEGSSSLHQDHKIKSAISMTWGGCQVCVHKDMVSYDTIPYIGRGASERKTRREVFSSFENKRDFVSVTYPSTKCICFVRMKCTARRAGSTEQFFEVVFRALHKLAIEMFLPIFISAIAAILSNTRKQALPSRC